MFMELPSKIECPHCGTENDVNLLQLADGHAMTCSRCGRPLLEGVETIRVEAEDVKTLIEGTQSTVLRNIALTFGVFFVIIILIFVGAHTVLDIQIQGEVILLIVGIFGAIFAVLLGFFWLVKKWFAAFK
jgi:uncharacterized paraquat-inducible protein A